MIKNADYKQQEVAFFVALVINAAVFPYSEALISISAGLLALQAFVFRSWKHPSVKQRSKKILFLPVSVFVVYLIGAFFTNDLQLALYELKKSVFWLVVPLAVFFSPQIKSQNLYLVFAAFITAVIVSSLIITGRLFFYNAIQLSEFRELSIISHIRFSVQVGFVLILLAWFLLQNKYHNTFIKPIWIIIAGIWLILFLFLLKSLVGIFAFLGTVIIACLYYAGKVKNRTLKIPLFVMFILILVLPFIYIGKVAQDFYNIVEVDPETVDVKTPSGNPYQHNFNEQMRENGHLVHVYICDEELREEWNKRSAVKYDDDLNGYPLGSTLIRYLSSLGYRKDSVGISKLTQEDIQLIERGATNYRFKNHFFSLYPRIYETIWEIDHYLRTNDPNNKTFAQRIEFLKASVLLIKQNPLLGIGTGNWVDKYNEAYTKMKTNLSYEKWSPSHNQYLNYIVKFGFIGFSWIIFAILFPIYKNGHRNNFIFIFFLLFTGIANLGDANLETHTGLSFFIFFYSLLLWNSTKLMNQSILMK